MTTESPNLNQQEHRAIIGACILAAFADGSQDESERAQIQRIVDSFPSDRPDLSAVYQDAINGKLTVAGLAGQLQTPASKSMAYQMAVCICYADGVLKDGEKRYLTDLWQALKLDGSSADHHDPVHELAA